MPSREEIKIRYEFHRNAAEKLRVAYFALAEGGVQSYSIGSRTLTKWDISTIMDEISEHEKKADELEAALLNGGKRRKAVGIVPRDF